MSNRLSLRLYLVGSVIGITEKQKKNCVTRYLQLNGTRYRFTSPQNKKNALWLLFPIKSNARFFFFFPYFPIMNSIVFAVLTLQVCIRAMIRGTFWGEVIESCFLRGEKIIPNMTSFRSIISSSFDRILHNPTQRSQKHFTE